MKVTNKLGLPQAIVDAVSVERHNQKGSYSATTLLHGACETILTERHYDEIEVDASESIWAIFGTAVHSVLEGQNTNTLKEQFYSVDVLNSKVTGRVDSYDQDTKTIHDFKTASVWKVQFNDFEDAMQYYTVLKAKADAIITRNGKDFAGSKLPIMTATEFLTSLE